MREPGPSSASCPSIWASAHIPPLCVRFSLDYIQEWHKQWQPVYSRWFHVVSDSLVVRCGDIVRHILRFWLEISRLKFCHSLSLLVRALNQTSALWRHDYRFYAQDWCFMSQNHTFSLSHALTMHWSCEYVTCLSCHMIVTKLKCDLAFLTFFRNNIYLRWGTSDYN